MIVLITCLLFAVGVLYYMLLDVRTKVQRLKEDLSSTDRRFERLRDEAWGSRRRFEEVNELRADVQRIADHLKIEFVDVPGVRKIAKVKKQSKQVV